MPGPVLICKFVADISMLYVHVTKLGGIITPGWAFKKISTKVEILSLKKGEISKNQKHLMKNIM